MIKFMIDSASDISKKEAEHYGIILVPMQVRFGDEEFFDGIDILPNIFYDKLVVSKNLPQTSLINEFRWEEEFKKATEDGSDVVLITISSKLSGTYSSAVETAKKFEGKVFVVDSLSAAIGERLLLERAISLANSGMHASDIARTLDEEKSKVKLYAVLDTLKYLKKGGRISATTAFVGEMLSIKPIVSVVDGEVKLVGKARGLKNANKELASLIKLDGGFDYSMPYGLLYSGNDDINLKKFTEDYARIWAENSRDIQAFQIGCTIGTHVGPGAYGVSFFRQ